MSSPPPEPEGHFDAVVVGSGFGGAVTAYRLAEAGMSVCVLERGKPYPPGSFPRSPWETGRNFWDPSEGLHGLFDVWSFRGLGGIVASGLGGGSLLWSNVVLRKDRSTFVKEEGEYWPVDYEDLEPHYERHERMLRATPYPFEREPYARTYKTRAMEHAAGELGLEWLLPPLAVSFAEHGRAPGEPILEDEPNLHGRTRLTCLLVGECNVGCNYGSKNTLDFNYLSRAKLRHGAEIRTRCEVKTFAPREGGGFTIGYVDHAEAPSDGPRERPLPIHTLTADRLVLSAGSFGTTYLLLKNRAAFPGLSARLGTRFCGNGDLLTLAIKAKENGAVRIVDPGFGPVITSTIRVPDAAEGGPGRGYYVQDGGHPQIVNWIVESSYQLNVFRKAARVAVRLVKLWLRFNRRSDIGREIAAFFSPASLSSSSLPLFSMGRDTPDGNMRLTDDGYLDVDWNKRSSTPFFEDLRQTGRDIARVLDAKFMDSPGWHLSRVVTVHPLGGCPMGRHEREGVVDSYGQVFGYPGLVIADGSVMPGPVGPNPSTTIAALAHRFADRLIADA
ncbi:MAG: GMC family oxidoreductase [Actinomycetota bacterium]|nr:GMC family oxidoreductase [Actinomycetota bacterium]